MRQRRVIIIGAAGRDFHNFNTRYRDDESVKVVAFTAEQIPGIDDRTYPAELAGPLYPEGIPIYPEERLADLIKELGADECAFSYSDISYTHVMRVDAIVAAAGRVLHAPRPGRHDGEEHEAGDLGLCRTHRFRQEPNDAPR